MVQRYHIGHLAGVKYSIPAENGPARLSEEGENKSIAGAEGRYCSCWLVMYGLTVERVMAGLRRTGFRYLSCDPRLGSLVPSPAHTLYADYTHCLFRQLVDKILEAEVVDSGTHVVRTHSGSPPSAIAPV